MSLIDDIKRNKGLGTLGNFDAAEPGDYGDYNGKSIVLIGDDLRIAVVLGDHAEAQANAARFEAVPQMEAALLAAEDSDLILQEAQIRDPHRSRNPDTGEEWVSLPADIWDALQDDIARVRAAYRKATGASQ